MSSGLSKASGTKAILDYIGIPKEESIAIGNGLNDKEMLSFVGMGVAMGNADEEVKACANRITKTNNEDGIVYALKELGLIQ